MIVDRLIYKIKDVSSTDFEKFRLGLDKLETAGKIPRIRFEIGQGASEYHYNLHISQGEGAVYIGWEHNTAKPNIVRGELSYDMKVEYNPQKLNESIRSAIEWIQDAFDGRQHLVTSLDLAHDMDVPRDNIVVVPTTGREENRYRSDRYYGFKSKDGYLKVYDKNRERREKVGAKEFDPDRPFWTRIEYTMKLKGGVSVDDLKRLELPEPPYRIWNVSGEEFEHVKPEIRACIYAVRMGYMQFKDFSRYKRPQIEKAFDRCEELALGSLIEDSWKDICKMVERQILKPDLLTL